MNTQEEWAQIRVKKQTKEILDNLKKGINDSGIKASDDTVIRILLTVAKQGKDKETIFEKTGDEL